MPSIISLAPLVGTIALASAAAVNSNTLAKRDLTAQLTLGSNQIPMATLDGQNFLGDALNDLCTGLGCDGGRSHSTDTFVVQLEDFGKKIECKWSATATGNYDNTNQRDYMINLMKAALTDTATVSSITTTIESTVCSQGKPGCETETHDITAVSNFLQVVLNQADGANNAEMAVHLSADCNNGFGFDCPAAISGNLKDALSAIPGVGDVIAQVFDLACS